MDEFHSFSNFPVFHLVYNKNNEFPDYVRADVCLITESDTIILPNKLGQWALVAKLALLQVDCAWLCASCAISPFCAVAWISALCGGWEQCY